MPTPVLASKLFLPSPRPNAVVRNELLARLQAGMQRRLTLIAAPAGFGKTSLAAAWARGCGRPVAWLALDDADNDPLRFLSYIVATMRTIAPTFGADVVALLEAAQPPPIDTILPLLINQIAALPQPALVVLDDYHALHSRPIDQALTTLLEYLPPHLHLAITTREEPRLPLARLRVRDQMTELRAADLRFSLAETAAFLGQVMGLSLAERDINILEARTEGWVAGLQLAALSLQGRPDASGFIRAFAGDNRAVMDYLVEEALDRQPLALRDFLLQTAILDRLCGPLCDAVTGQERSDAQLEALHRGNFFVVPLDDQRRWYRYHHLFRDVLAVHLQDEQPDQAAQLHRRASVWYAQNDAPADAIRHALAAGDAPRAADLIELAAPAFQRQRQERTLLGWLRQLPDDLLACRPVLSVYYAGALLSAGDLAGVEARLRDAEQRLTPLNNELAGTQAATVVRDEAALRRLPGSIAIYRAAQALALGDLAATAEYAGQALEHVEAADQLWRGAATGLLGLAAWTRGELETAYRTFAAGLDQLETAGNIADAIGGSLALADIRTTQGRLSEAQRIYERGLQLAADHGTPQLRGTADMYVGLSEIAYERGDLAGALEYLQRSEAQGEHTGFPQHPYRRRVALARIRSAQGDWAGALDLLHEAERRYVGDFFPNVRPIAAWKARLWLAQGRLDDALDWAQAQGLSARDELTYLQEFAHITLARILLARSQRDAHTDALQEAVHLLERLHAAAAAGGRTSSVIEILILRSLASAAQGRPSAAQVTLARALTLAEPEGAMRSFVDEGQAMAALLEQTQAEGGTMKSSLLALRRAFAKHPAVHPSSFIPLPLIEPLSDRERTVLRLLRSDLGGPAIARELIISLNTLRTHTKNIYAKLDVNNRRAAVRRAEELGLL